ncbi:hypothetical protein MJO28_010831 [Puccinia striiformis f. sp. tritici]|uniref:Uncharacterized protein n=3 Tax=Puccinia striiformis TaxID=27350 RepID=A0A2S4UTU8_9BASI|nr:hypothetical protein MJO28_010831 [Puccinia striiformis f. sp. tritici]POW00709.1 hypothetical protein PSTT_12965 [Puccinia striiformis]POW04203.1 hypothetical protein PSHT_11413 [Puccinia striiformis]
MPALFPELLMVKPQRASKMEPTPFMAVVKLMRLQQRFERALQSKEYQEVLRKESKKDSYLTTQARVITLKQLIERGSNLESPVHHPRICLLRKSYDYAPLELLGTLPCPSPNTQGQLLTCPRRLCCVAEDVDRLKRLIAELDLACHLT